MNVLAELQKRGFQVQMCPGRVEIVSSLAMRQKAAEDGVTVWDQVNEHMSDIIRTVGTSAIDEAFEEFKAKHGIKDQA